MWRLYVAIVLIASVCYAENKLGLKVITEHKPSDCSTTAANGDTVAVHYTGKLENGKIFDSSVVSKRDPIKFALGAGKVIPGWERGILGMCVGEKRKLIIPPELAYGDKGVKDVIPPQATLTFETELMELDKVEVTLEDKLRNFIAVAMWPAIALLLLVFLYVKIGQDEEEERVEKTDKKGRKKKQ